MAVAVLALLVAGAASAPAATTVGSSLSQRANLYVRCAPACTDVQTARPGGTSLGIPADGVLTLWRIRAASLGTVRLRVVRPRDDGTLRVVASADPQKADRPHEPGKDVLYTFSARIAVREGDRLALDRDKTMGALFHSYGNDTSWATATLAAQPADGATVTPPEPAIGRELLLNADVEADADGDGYGDDTQDACPKDAAAHEAAECPGATSTVGAAPGTTPGTTSTPGAVDVGGPTTTGRQTGPPLQGEPTADREQRGHGNRLAARPEPRAQAEEAGAHGGRPSARPTPRRARTERDSHGRRVGARPTPKRKRTGADSHGRRPGARQTPQRETQSAEGHPKRPARKGPSARKRKPSAEHDARNERPAPKPVPKSPGPQPHAPRPERPSPGAS